MKYKFQLALQKPNVIFEGTNEYHWTLQTLPGLQINTTFNCPPHIDHFVFYSGKVLVQDEIKQFQCSILGSQDISLVVPNFQLGIRILLRKLQALVHCDNPELFINYKSFLKKNSDKHTRYEFTMLKPGYRSWIFAYVKPQVNLALPLNQTYYNVYYTDTQNFISKCGSYVFSREKCNCVDCTVVRATIKFNTRDMSCKIVHI